MKKIRPEKFPNPFDTFTRWLHEEITNSDKKFPSACVLSTFGLNGFPNARNVSLKEIHHPYLIITTATNSVKGLEISKNNKVALTFWWEKTMRQVRIQGVATLISEDDADFYFSERSKSSQAVSVVSEQSKPLKNIKKLRQSYRTLLIDNKNNQITRPKNWRGYKINPHQIEFLEFKESRFHNRVLYTENEEAWEVTNLQP